MNKQFDVKYVTKSMNALNSNKNSHKVYGFDNENDGDEDGHDSGGQFLTLPSQKKSRKPGIASDTALTTAVYREMILNSYQKKQKHYQSAPRTFTYDKLIQVRIDGAPTSSPQSEAMKQLLRNKLKISAGGSNSHRGASASNSGSINSSHGESGRIPDRYVTTSYTDSLDQILKQSAAATGAAVAAAKPQLEPNSRQLNAQHRLSILNEESGNQSLSRPVSRFQPDDIDDLMPSATVNGDQGGAYDYQQFNDMPSVLDDNQFIQYTSQDIQYEPRQKAPKLIGRYVMGDVLGEGSYGKVKEGYCIETLRRTAIKIMKQARLKKIPNGELNVRREINVLKRLRHKNVVELMDVIVKKEKQKIYVVFEYCATTLSEIIGRSSEGKLPLSQSQRYFKQMMKGLRYLHANSVIHRDIKPGNLLVTIDDTIKISDFGVAEEVSRYSPNDNLTTSSGSPAFQPPEVALGKDSFSGSKVDIWAAGVTLYHIISGKYPFDGDSIYQLFENIGRCEYTIPEEADEILSDLIRNILCIDPDSRFGVDQILSHPWTCNKLKKSQNEVPVVPLQRSDDFSLDQDGHQQSRLMSKNTIPEEEDEDLTGAVGRSSGDIITSPSQATKFSKSSTGKTQYRSGEISNPDFAYDTTLIPYLEQMFEDMPHKFRRSSVVELAKRERKPYQYWQQ
ncbi:hypothetical protein MIR68_010453 [Amoeboaphelidium protococcarum]|nr:hypothetical protein MIR68_010453 [Amoeboaphelidium protococcarum]